tara:strand:- start:2919 stop:3221 length:303 start_codon:yes stop_codon:yes gene_type:complete
MFEKFGRNRMRISEKTLKVVGQRKHLKAAHVQYVSDDLEEFDIALVSINRGFCLLRMSALDGERSYSFKTFKSESEMPWRDEDAMWSETSHLRDIDVDDD